jgi:hypothetical protein
MDIISKDQMGVLIRLTSEEITVINNAINEALELDDWEFDARMGAPKERVKVLLKAFNQL